MKILFMGTPDFAAVVLDRLARSEHEIVGAVSQPDKPKGRGHKLVPTDVKLKAQEYNIPVYQPETLKNNAMLGLLRELDPEMIVVAAYGKILPEYVIDYPKYGCFNVHPSLLPKYRGAAPIQWAVLNGDEKTGIAVMKMDKGLDTGDIVLMEEREIGEYETSGELFDRLAVDNSELLIKAIAMVENGTATYTKQDDSKHTYAPMYDKSISPIDWNRTNAEISKHICGLNPYPLATTTYEGVTLKVADAVKTDGEGNPGEILSLDKGKGLKVACGKGALYLKNVQFAGSKRMNVEDYARGHELKIGVILGK